MTIDVPPGNVNKTGKNDGVSGPSRLRAGLSQKTVV